MKIVCMLRKVSWGVFGKGTSVWKGKKLKYSFAAVNTKITKAAILMQRLCINNYHYIFQGQP